MPRGLTSLRRRLSEDKIKELKIDSPLKMLEEGLRHTQKVYAGVKEFTNLVKEDVQLARKEHNLGEILRNYLSSTSYIKQVAIDRLPTIEVNEPLFCTAIDNLIRNGLKYNDSSTKVVTIYMENDYTLCVEDNGRGMTQEEFIELSKPYTRKKDQKEGGSGLGLNICIAILKEHGFGITAEKTNPGTKLRIKVK
jgi:signal transduction histidine kinase